MSDFILMAILAYFCGSLPSGVWIGKIFKNIDIREHGSNNSGATNAYRVLGPKYGFIVLAADAMKGYLPLYIAQENFGQYGNSLIALGLIAIMGHTLSCFLDFKGGKGVATSLGVFLYLFPSGIITVFIAFVIIVKFTKYISLGSIIGAILMPILACFLPMKEGIDRLSLFVLSLLVGSFVVYKHKSNIERLLKGTENKFKLKK